MLTLDLRPAKLGVNLNTRREKHGDDPVPAKDLRIKNILLTEAEINALFDAPDAWDRLYVHGVKASKTHSGAPPTPYWGKKLGALPVPGKWRESWVLVKFGLHEFEADFKVARLSKVKLEPQVGGLTAMSLTVSCLKANIAGAQAEHLDEFLDTDVTVSIEFGDPDDDDDDDDEQDELALDHNAEATA